MNEKKESRPTFIYVLKDPRTGEVRYVGKTNQSLAMRLSKHLSSKDKSYRTSWIQSLLKEGVKPTIALIQEVPCYENYEIWEVFWIKLYRDLGCKLVNTHDGGEWKIGRAISAKTVEKSARGHMKPVAQYTLEGKFVDRWESVKAAEALGMSSNNITHCARRNGKTAGGYMWRYWNETLGADIEPYANPFTKPIARYTRLGKFIDKWESASAAGRELDINKDRIGDCARLKIPTAGSYQWRYWSETLGADIEPVANKHKKPIARYTLDSVFIDEWESAVKAGRSLGIVPSGITACLKGRTKTAGGFKWKYLADKNVED